MELVRAGRSPGSLAREFEPSEQTIRNWARRADLDEGRRADGLTTEARREVRRKRVARLMRELGTEGVTRRRFGTGTTKRDPRARPAEDLVNRRFSANGPDLPWVADITQVRGGAGWLCLAFVLDAWSRRIVGWAMDSAMPAELVGGFYNTRRIHSALGYRSPANFERLNRAA